MFISGFSQSSEPVEPAGDICCLQGDDARSHQAAKAAGARTGRRSEASHQHCRGHSPHPGAASPSSVVANGSGKACEEENLKKLNNNNKKKKSNTLYQ